MPERLTDRHTKRVQEGASRYLERKRLLRDFIGPGGVKLNRVEQLQLYKDALNDPDLMLGILQNRQEANKVPPDGVPRDWIAWMSRMQAMEATEEPLEDTEGTEAPNIP